MQAAQVVGLSVSFVGSLKMDFVSNEGGYEDWQANEHVKPVQPVHGGIEHGCDNGRSQD
jgi:hypothetical protein